ncbi:MAG: hypothetical protein K9K79_06790 [Desulfohalobiaceae bacterium]|nr:hypothetical protein [Desulfohalobiaceae bacterium]
MRRPLTSSTARAAKKDDRSYHFIMYLAGSNHSHATGYILRQSIRLKGVNTARDLFDLGRFFSEIHAGKMPQARTRKSWTSSLSGSSAV